MRLDKLTQKAREAVLAAQASAAEHDHQAVDVPHVCLALVTQEDGVVPPLLEKIGVPQGALAQKLRDHLRGLPKVQGGEPYLSQELSKVLAAAQKHADQMKDDYVSTEHLFLAVVESKSRTRELLA